MATSQKLTDQFLTCAVCFEVFTDPVTLECYHTFCRQCVISVTKKQPEAITAKSLPCPTCRRLTKVTNHARPVDEWANQMKPSFVNQGLTDSFGPGSKDTTNCSLCQKDGETTTAVSWCSVCDVSLCNSCMKAHRRNPASQHHDVSDLSNELKVKRQRKVQCTEHKDEFIKFYCKGCKKPLCHICCILYHRRCDDLVLLESMVPEMKSVLEKRKDMLTSKLQETSNLLTKTKASCDDVQQNKTSMQSQVRSTCQAVIDEINKKGKSLIDEIENVTEKQMGQLKARLKTTEMTVQTYQQDIEMINHVLESDSENDLSSLYQSLSYKTVDSSLENFKEFGESEIHSRVRLTQDTDKLSRSVEELQIGTVDVMNEGGLNLSFTPVFQDSIDIKVTDDKTSSCATDVIVLDVNGTDAVVVIDSSNKSVKSFYKRNNQECHSALKVGGSPWNIGKLKHNQVAVTVLTPNHIVIIEVNPELTLLSCIKTPKMYGGIVCQSSAT